MPEPLYDVREGTYRGATRESPFTSNLPCQEIREGGRLTFLAAWTLAKRLAGWKRGPA